MRPRQLQGRLKLTQGGEANKPIATIGQIGIQKRFASPDLGPLYRSRQALSNAKQASAVETLGGFSFTVPTPEKSLNDKSVIARPGRGGPQETND
jgi:hypothetical protein